MKNSASLIPEYLESFWQGDEYGAFCGLTEMPHDVLPELIAAFHKEQDRRIRAFLVEVIWQHRQHSVIPFLTEVLRDPEPRVWKEALNGLVTLASAQALDALNSARTRQFRRQQDTEEFRKWLEEAIEQVVNEIQDTQH